METGVEESEIERYQQPLGAPGETKPLTTPVTENDTLAGRMAAAKSNPSDEYLLSLPSDIPLEDKFQKRRDELLKASSPQIDPGGSHKIQEPFVVVPLVTSKDAVAHLGPSSGLAPK